MVAAGDVGVEQVATRLLQEELLVALLAVEDNSSHFLWGEGSFDWLRGPVAGCKQGEAEG